MGWETRLSYYSTRTMSNDPQAFGRVLADLSPPDSDALVRHISSRLLFGVLVQQVLLELIEVLRICSALARIKYLEPIELGLTDDDNNDN